MLKAWKWPHSFPSSHYNIRFAPRPGQPSPGKHAPGGNGSGASEIGTNTEMEPSDLATFTREDPSLTSIVKPQNLQGLRGQISPSPV